MLNKHVPLNLAIAILFTSTLLSPAVASAQAATAPVSGFARNFLTDGVIPDAIITILETGQKLKTNNKGEFGPFEYPVGQQLTLTLEKNGYTTTQTETVKVPAQGLTGPYDNITFQVPSNYVYYILSTLIGAKIDENSCHVVTTITEYHKTLDDLPQGEEDAIAVLTPFVNEKPFYFDIFKSGPLKDKTYPFPTGITQTSRDGGVAFFNLPPRDEPYRITAQKSGTTFTEAEFICRKDMFINISPPRGPMAQKR